MAKPKLDIKKLLLERGERLGLSVAGIITLLLILFALLMPGKGVFSGSPEEKAKGLTGPAAYITHRLSDPTNLPGDSDKPDKDSEKKLIAFEMKVVNGDDYRMLTMIPGGIGGDLGRRVPKVLNIDEAVIKLARMQIQTYIIENNRIYVLKGEKGSAREGQGKNLGMMMGGGPKGSGPKGPGGRGFGLRGRPGAGGDDEKKPTKQLISIKIEDVEKHNDVTLAEQLRPLRMAIIAASFPYKAQVEEFRAKLALRGSNEVLAENGVSKIGGRIRPSFYFSGVDVERRELDGDGNPV